MTTIVCDASLVVKLLVPEEHSDRAMALAASSSFIAPEIIFAEVGNVLWTRIHTREFDLDTGQSLLEGLNSFSLEARPIRPLIGRGLEIAAELDHAIYDRLYLALAERIAAPLVTADLRFAKAVRRRKMRTIEIKLISEFT